ncbi:MAG: PHP domain-containing protein [Myxococcota bacterium]
MTAARTAQEVAEALEQVAALMEFAGENPYRARAYQRGAQAVRGLGGELGQRLQQGTLTELPGIGKGLQAVIQVLAAGGEPASLTALKQHTPPGVLEVARLKGVGARKARLLHDALGIAGLKDLEAAARDGRLLSVKGFGPRTRDRILDELARARAQTGQCRLDVAFRESEAVRAALATLPLITRSAVAGEARRGHEVVTRVVVVAASPAPELATWSVIDSGRVRAPELTARGVLRCGTGAGVPGELHVVAEGDYAAALLFHSSGTGHLLALRAHSGGLELTAEGARAPSGPVPFDDEDEIYRALDLQPVPVELREDGSEVELARAGALPTLLQLSDLRGSLHNHTLASDGNDTLADMQAAAAALGLQYLGISDHSRSAFYARGLSMDALREQREQMAGLAGRGVELLQGVESDILEDGALDYPEEFLVELDYVVASVHSRFRQDAEQMTRRLCAAARHPFTDVVGHPTGRLVLSREPYAFDLAAVLSAAREGGCAMELNAHPNRLDLGAEHLRACRRAGVPVCINSDAHTAEGLSDLRWGVMVARHAGLTAHDVINTRDAAGIRAWLANRRRGAREMH